MSAIGEFRERVSVQEEQRVTDTGGGVALGWQEVAEVWAAIDPLRGKENVQQEAVTGVGSYRISFRAGVVVTVAMRLVWRLRIFNIRAVRVLDARERLVEILAEESVAV
jgi:SPP1 family predicted phage head-tail adaptor